MSAGDEGIVYWSVRRAVREGVCVLTGFGRVSLSSGLLKKIDPGMMYGIIFRLVTLTDAGFDRLNNGHAEEFNKEMAKRYERNAKSIQDRNSRGAGEL